MLRSLSLTLCVALATPVAMAVGPAATGAAPAPIDGYYLAHDDKTGFVRALMRIKENPQTGELSAVIAKILPRPGYTPKMICNPCAGVYSGKPVTGLDVFQGVKRNATKPTTYTNGTVLDPVSGKIYSALITSTKGGQTIKVRGYLGVPLMGRTAYWMQTNEPERYLKAADPIRSR